MAGQMGHILDNLFCTITLGCAIDLTLHFRWLEEGFITGGGDEDKRFATEVNLTMLH